MLGAEFSADTASRQMRQDILARRQNAATRQLCRRNRWRPLKKFALGLLLPLSDQLTLLDSRQVKFVFDLGKRAQSFISYRITTAPWFGQRQQSCRLGDQGERVRRPPAQFSTVRQTPRSNPAAATRAHCPLLPRIPWRHKPPR